MAGVCIFQLAVRVWLHPTPVKRIPSGLSSSQVDGLGQSHGEWTDRAPCQQLFNHRRVWALLKCATCVADVKGFGADEQRGALGTTDEQASAPPAAKPRRSALQAMGEHAGPQEAAVASVEARAAVAPLLDEMLEGVSGAGQPFHDQLEVRRGWIF